MAKLKKVNYDEGVQETDILISKMEKEISKEYQQAYEEVSKKLNKYMEGFEEREEWKRLQLLNNEITEKEFNQWRLNQMAIGDRWKAMQDTLARDLVLADKKAASIINGYTPSAYALNHNFGTYEIEKGTNINTSYTLYNIPAVERLLREKPNLLPKAKVDASKDEKWNKKKINSAVMQGILQGDDLKSVSKRLQSVTNMDDNAAIRNARTMMTSAQNAGRLDAYRRSAKLGIKVQKQWMATLDKHTRESHRALDGEVTPLNKAFSNGLMYPGDTKWGANMPAEIYNCRCTLVANYPEYPDGDYARYDNIEGKPIKNVNFSEWLKAHESGTQEFIEESIGRYYALRDLVGHAYNSKYTEEDLKKLEELYNSAPEEVKEFYAKYGGELKPNIETNSEGVTPRTKIDFGFYRPSEDRVHFITKRDKNGRSDQLPFELGAHEYGHNMDYIAGKLIYGSKYTTISNSYRNSEGLTFGQIINNDWRKAVLKFVGKEISPSETPMDIYEWQFRGQEDEKNGGMGAYGFARNILVQWRIRSGTKRSDPIYQQMSDELLNLRDSGGDIFDFMLKYKKEFYGEVTLEQSTKIAYQNYVDSLGGKVTAEDIKKFCKMMRSDYKMSERGCLSDMFENFSVTNGGDAYPFGIGHGEDYATNGGIFSTDNPAYYARLERESFAEFTEMCIVNHDALEVAKKYLPNAYEAYLDMIRKANAG